MDIKRLTDFNSTLVWLKDPGRLFANEADRFQFHFGLIKSPSGMGKSLYVIGISIPLWSD